MCGISGWIGGVADAGDQGIAQEMAAAVTHRGPDGGDAAALWCEDGVAGWFGHRRLKILDLTQAADQPMSTDDGKVTLTFNGEIYNFQELRRDLEARGHAFRSSGDTEVVLRSYEEWKEDCLRRLDGMFALAIWDGRCQRLLLARDRTGKKPLFYTVDRGRLTFGSEIKALAHAPWVRLAPGLTKLPQLLAFGYLTAPDTIYDGISQLRPASAMTFQPSGGNRREWTYWSLPEVTAGVRSATRVRDLVRQATVRRMVSDAPIGALLSGGIDSSVIAALMTEESGSDVRTFSVGFADESSYDERSYARRVAAHLGTHHREFVVEVDAGRLLDRLVWLHDGPFADSSAIPTYLVCEAAAQHVRVVLTGDGGDEVFAGYQRFVATAMSQRLGQQTLRAARRAIGVVPRGSTYFDPRTRLERYLAGAAMPMPDRYLSWITVFGESERERLLRQLDRQDDALEPFLSVYAAGRDDVIDRVLRANFLTYLPGDLSMKLDRMSMAHSLEARAPFLDTDVVEEMFRWTASEKLGYLRPKPVLRRAFRSVLPGFVFRRPKHGFGVPMDRWFRGELGTRYADEVMAADSHLRQILPAEALDRLWLEHRDGTATHGPRMWLLLTIECWLRALENGLREPSLVAVSAD